MDLLQCVSWSLHTEDPADGRLRHAAPPLDLKPHHHRGLSSGRSGKPPPNRSLSDRCLTPGQVVLNATLDRVYHRKFGDLRWVEERNVGGFVARRVVGEMLQGSGRCRRSGRRRRAALCLRRSHARSRPDSRRSHDASGQHPLAAVATTLELVRPSASATTTGAAGTSEFAAGAAASSKKSWRSVSPVSVKGPTTR